MMRSIYAYHTQTRGWGDIGYNVIVDKFGRIFEGRYGGLASHGHRRARRRVQHLHVRRLDVSATSSKW